MVSFQKSVHIPRQLFHNRGSERIAYPIVHHWVPGQVAEKEAGQVGGRAILGKAMRNEE